LKTLIKDYKFGVTTRRRCYGSSPFLWITSIGIGITFIIKRDGDVQAAVWDFGVYLFAGLDHWTGLLD
jgi:hypothetical protein